MKFGVKKVHLYSHKSKTEYLKILEMVIKMHKRNWRTSNDFRLAYTYYKCAPNVWKVPSDTNI